MEGGGTVNSSSDYTCTDAGALPAWITAELIAETIRVWAPKYQRPLTDGDAIEILLNVGSLLDAVWGIDDDALSGLGEGF